VIVAAPTFLHHEIGMWCLEHGIHVLMEKPIAASHREASELTELAESRSLTLQVGHVERFNPAWTYTAEQVRGHGIRYIEAAREGTYSGRSTDIGIVMDLMIHDLDLIMSAVDSSVESVKAYGWNVLGGHEDFAIATLRFRNGAMAHLRASRISPVARRQMQIFSEHGQWDVDFAAGTVTTTLAREEVASGARKADSLPADLRVQVKDKLFDDWLCKTTVQPAARNAIQCEQFEFFSAVRYATPVTVTGKHGARALEVAAWILDSMEPGQSTPAVIPMQPRIRTTKAA
jgi:predicted dehydrogenase